MWLLLAAVVAIELLVVVDVDDECVAVTVLVLAACFTYYQTSG
jgi:hypothetical protein